MAISKTARAALRALSYPAALDMDKSYKMERVIRQLRAPLAPLYRHWDHRLLRDDRAEYRDGPGPHGHPATTDDPKGDIELPAEHGAAE